MSSRFYKAGANALFGGFARGSAASQIVAGRGIFTGDSITAYGAGFSGMFDADHPKLDIQIDAVSGTAINTGANSFMSRQAASLALKPEVLVVLAGANDLSDSATYPTVTDWMNALYAYTDPFKAIGTKIVVAVPLPQATAYPGSATHNTRRATVRTTLIAAIGTKVDAVIDWNTAAGGMGADATANDAAKYSDGLHPTDAGHLLMNTDVRTYVRPQFGLSTTWSPTEWVYVGSGGANGFIYDPTSKANLFQDTSALTPVTTVGNTVYRINDTSGYGYHMLRIAGTPTYQEASAVGYVDVAGAEAFQTASFGAIAQPHYDCVGAKLDSVAATVVLTDGATGARMALLNVAGGDLFIQGGAGVDTTLNLTTSPCVIEGLFQGGSSTARLDGTAGASVNAGANSVSQMMWAAGIGPGNFIDGRLRRRCGTLGTIPNTRVQGYMRSWASA